MTKGYKINKRFVLTGITKYIAAFCIIVLLIPSLTFAATDYLGRDIKKRSVIVLALESRNCSSEMGNSLAFMLASQLESSDIFYFSQIKDGEVELLNNDINCSSPACAVKYGRQAGADKVIFGYIERRERQYVTDTVKQYFIDIEVVDTQTGEIEVSIPYETDDIGQFKNVMARSAGMIERVYYGHSEISGEVDVSITASALYPSGDFREGAGFGYGAHFNIFFKAPLWMMTSIGFYNFVPRMESIKSIFMMPVGIHFPYYISLGVNKSIIPSIGCGVIFGLMEHDSVAHRASGDYIYLTEYFFNPIITARLEFNMLLSRRWNLVITPHYSLMTGNGGNIAHIIALDVGMKMNF